MNRELWVHCSKCGHGPQRVLVVEREVRTNRHRVVRFLVGAHTCVSCGKSWRIRVPCG